MVLAIVGEEVVDDVGGGVDPPLRSEPGAHDAGSVTVLS